MLQFKFSLLLHFSSIMQNQVSKTRRLEYNPVLLIGANDTTYQVSKQEKSWTADGDAAMLYKNWALMRLMTDLLGQ